MPKTVVEIIKSGHEEALLGVLKSGADANEVDSGGTPAIVHTLENSGKPEMLKALLDAGANPNARCPANQRTALHIASKLGYQQCVTQLLSAGANPGLSDARGCTALIHAAKGSHVSVVKLLLHTNRVDLSSKNLEEETVLHAAVKGGSLECIQMLLDSSADCNAVDANGNTPLLLACKQNSTAIAAMLLLHSSIDPTQAFCSINAQELSTGKSALHWAVQHGNTDMLDLLLEHGADPNQTDVNWESAFLSAIRVGGNRAIMQRLIDAGCNVTVTDRSFNTALHFAATEGLADAIPLLIEAGVDVNLKGFSGLTPLMLAAFKGHEEVVRILCASGARLDMLDRNHASALVYSLIRGTMEQGCEAQIGTLKTLIRFNCNVNEGAGLRQLCSAQVIELACKSSKVVEDRMYSPLEIAYLRGNTEAFKILIRAGCDLNNFNMECVDVETGRWDHAKYNGMLQYLARERTKIKTLREMCRKSALEAISGSVPIADLHRLGLSDEIKEFLMFADLDDIFNPYKKVSKLTDLQPGSPPAPKASTPRLSVSTKLPCSKPPLPYQKSPTTLFLHTSMSASSSTPSPTSPIKSPGFRSQYSNQTSSPSPQLRSSNRVPSPTFQLRSSNQTSSPSPQLRSTNQTSSPSLQLTSSNRMPSPTPQLKSSNQTSSPSPQLRSSNRVPSPTPQLRSSNPNSSPTPQLKSSNRMPSPTPQLKFSKQTSSASPQLRSSNRVPSPTPQLRSSNPTSSPTPQLKSSNRMSSPTPQLKSSKQTSSASPQLRSSNRVPSPMPQLKSSNHTSSPTPQLKSSNRTSLPSPQLRPSNPTSSPSPQLRPSNRMSSPLPQLKSPTSRISTPNPILRNQSSVASSKVSRPRSVNFTLDRAIPDVSTCPSKADRRSMFMNKPPPSPQVLKRRTLPIPPRKYETDVAESQSISSDVTVLQNDRCSWNSHVETNGNTSVNTEVNTSGNTNGNTSVNTEVNTSGNTNGNTKCGNTNGNTKGTRTRTRTRTRTGT